MQKEQVSEITPKTAKGEDFFVLASPGRNASDHNIFLPGYGYLTEHIEPNIKRDNPTHWDSQFEKKAPFLESWKPREAPLKFVSELLKNHDEDRQFTVISLGAGLGDFTTNLAELDPEIFVIHNDFSKKANQIAAQTVAAHGVESRVEISTRTNRELFNKLIAEGVSVDMMFIYGGLTGNTPLESEIAETFELATQVINEGCYIWFVGLIQPFLEGKGDRRAADIIGEYPHHPDTVKNIIREIPDLHIVREDVAQRPDKHHLRPGGDPEDHLHVIERYQIVYSPEGLTDPVPNIGFK